MLGRYNHKNRCRIYCESFDDHKLRPHTFEDPTCVIKITTKHYRLIKLINDLSYIPSSVKYKVICIEIYDRDLPWWIATLPMSPRKLFDTITEHGQSSEVSLHEYRYTNDDVINETIRFIKNNKTISSLSIRSDHQAKNHHPTICKNILKCKNIKNLRIESYPPATHCLVPILRNLQLNKLYIGSSDHNQYVNLFNDQLQHALIDHTSLHTLEFNISSSTFDASRSAYDNIIKHNTNIKHITIPHKSKYIEDYISRLPHITSVNVCKLDIKDLNSLLKIKHIKRLEFDVLPHRSISRKLCVRNFTLLRSDSLCKILPSYKYILRRNDRLHNYRNVLIDLVLLFAHKLDPYLIVKIFDYLSKYYYRHISAKIKVDIAIGAIISLDNIINSKHRNISSN